MANPYNVVKVPSASHGLHKKEINVPRLFTANFYEHIPTYSWKFRKDDRIDVNYHFFNRLFPLPVPSLVTGRTSIKGYFVPMRSIFRGWSDFITKSQHTFSDGTSAVISKRRYFTDADFTSTFIADTNLVTNGSSTDYDIVYIDSSSILSYYKFTAFGSVVYKIFRALGYKFAWDEDDRTEYDATRVLAYIRVMLDHYFPKQYMHNSVYNRFLALCEYDMSGSTQVSATDLIDGVGHFVYGYYNDSIFCSAWDSPAAPTLGLAPAVRVVDDTNDANFQRELVTNYPSGSTSPSNANYKPMNGTAYIGSDGSVTPNSGSTLGVLTQFVLDALQSVNNFLRRHQLGGNRAIENYLMERGVAISKQEVITSFELDSYSVPFEINDVAATSDVSVDSSGTLINGVLGDLAGKGQNSSEGVDIKFKETFDSDGIFIVIEAAIPDNDMVCAMDATNLEITPLDSHTPTFDKLGTAIVPSRILYQDISGYNNRAINAQQFGFLDRYWQENTDYPLVYGDFDVISRGSQTLSAYHTFRLLHTYISGNSWNLVHAYDFLRVGKDNAQYSRIFYSSKGASDNMLTSVRLKGVRYTQKLPYGDSFDWDDDEFNKQVSIVANGGKE